nr:xylan 1,4-beta-xylosidase [Lachnospiraceae bacterium]
MANPYLPGWEYIPDGEPHVFGDRVYIYGSHDKPHEEYFCDTKMKVWSASVNDLEHWVCHGDMFHTCDDSDHKSETPWTNNHIFAPDVVCKDGKYYLFCYIEGAYGCVAVSDRPEGPFKTLGQ